MNNNKPWKLPVLRQYKLRSGKVDAPFRCVHLSDLHCCLYGKHQKTLLDQIRMVKPDLICMTGDMLEPKFGKEGAGDLFAPLGEMYPCFYVTGNHEFNYKNYLGAKSYVRSFGICVLEGECRTVTLRSGTRICVAGIDDPMNPMESWMSQLSRVARSTDTSAFSILLSHRPERAQTYAMFPFNLVLTGHAHGGQWRIPGLVNGIYAPSQGFFPKYAGGRYKINGQIHINSRGLAYYVPVPRIFNPVEFGVIDVVPGNGK